MNIVNNAHGHPSAHEVEEIVSQYIPAPVVSFLVSAGIRIVPLGEGMRFAEASPALRKYGIDVDQWFLRPSGLFVVDEKTVYAGSFSALTIIHELGHGFDCALGDGLYLSGLSGSIRRAYADAKFFVTPYAGSGVDEFFAEGFRAYFGANDAVCPWPTVTRARLEKSSPALLEFFDETFAKIEREQRA